MAVPPKTNFKKKNFLGDSQKLQGKPLLVLCTENHFMTMANDKVFYTGNHLVETLVPLRHVKNAGIELQFVTLTGKAVAIEEWALPQKDQEFLDFYQSCANDLAHPISLEEASTKRDSFCGIFIPGGHGAMLELPENKQVGDLLKFFMIEKKTVASLCHGPAVFLAAPEIFKGYTIAAFPDVMDKFTPFIGYLPGPMPWYFGEKLKKAGLNIRFSLGLGTCHRDRNVVTGDGPMAANKLGTMMVEALFED